MKTPEGKEIEFEKSKIVYKDLLPKKFEDLGVVDGYFVSTLSEIRNTSSKANHQNKNVSPTEKEALADIEMPALRQLRDKYNGEPLEAWAAWTDSRPKWVITVEGNEIATGITFVHQRQMAFKTEELLEEFLENFRKELEIAKPCL